jgi:hypothetical protein
MSISTVFKGYTISARAIERTGKTWAFYAIEKDSKLVRIAHVPLPQGAVDVAQTALAHGVIYADEELE